MSDEQSISMHELALNCELMHAAMTEDQVLGLYEQVCGYKQILKEADAALKTGLMQWINTHGDIQHGDKRFYVGTKRATKINPNKADVLMTILEANGGDLDQLAELLASEPIKQGAVKKLLGEELWGRCFTVAETPDLKTGKPVKELKVVNERFLPQKEEQANAKP